MVLGYVVFQIVVVVVIHVAQFLAYGGQQGLLLCGSEHVVERVVGQRAHRQQRGVVEIAFHMRILAPFRHSEHALQGLIGVCLLARQHIGAGQQLYVALLGIDHLAALARQKRVHLHFVGQRGQVFRGYVVQRQHRLGQCFFGILDVPFALLPAFRGFQQGIAVGIVGEYAGMSGG